MALRWAKRPRPSIDQGKLVPDDLVNRDGRRASRSARHASAATSSTAFPAPSTRPIGSTAQARRRPSRRPSRRAISIVVDSDATPPPHHGAAHLSRAAGSTTSTRIHPRSPASVMWTAQPSSSVRTTTEAVFTGRMKTFETQTAPVDRALPQAGPFSKKSTADLRSSRSPRAIKAALSDSP